MNKFLNKKLIVLFIVILVILVSGCNKKTVEEKPQEIKSIENFLKLSREMSGKINSNSTMKELGNYFNSIKSEIDKDLYKSKFDFSNSLNTVVFQSNYIIEKTDVLRVYADTIQEKDVVKVIVISNYLAEPDYYYIDSELEDKHSEYVSGIITEVFEYSLKDNKMIKYEKF